MIRINRRQVIDQMNQCTPDELAEWRKHAVKCLNYFLKYRNDYEIEECNFVISQIDQRISGITDMEKT
ncbi:MAG TPA: hypothetical protein DEO65_17150 [Bacillus bacterium]|nr:hypothetical protein [Bacillus sp. (in: firmicutes)]